MTKNRLNVATLERTEPVMYSIHPNKNVPITTPILSSTAYKLNQVAYSSFSFCMRVANNERDMAWVPPITSPTRQAII